MPYPVVAGPYLADLLAQPEALLAVRTVLERTTLDAAVPNRLRDGTFRRVILTGMGSSLHALYPLHLVLCARGIASIHVETSELLIGYEALRACDTLLVAVSQSGESAEMRSLLKSGAAFGHIIGVTNNPTSALGRAANTVLLLAAGIERTVSCKTYLNTLVVLHWLGSILTASDTTAALAEVSETVPQISSYLAKWEVHVSDLSQTVKGVRSLFVTGRGRSLATAWTGGLILKEATRRHAEGMSCAAFRHGPLEMIGHDVLVLVLAGDARTEALHRQLVSDIANGGGRAELIATAGTSSEVFQLPTVAAAMLPLVELLPLQMISLALAARDGREAGRFERATKITTTA